MLPGPTNEKAAEFKVKNVDTKIENKIIQYVLFEMRFPFEYLKSFKNYRVCCEIKKEGWGEREKEGERERTNKSERLRQSD